MSADIVQTISRSGSANSDKSQVAGTIPVAQILAIVFQLPYVVLYFKNLRGFAHYDFFPLAIGCFLFFVWRRRGDGVLPSTRLRGALVALLLSGSGLSCILAILFSSPWIAYFGFLLGTSSLLVKMRDGQSNHSLAILVVLLAILWQPPYSPNLTGDVVFTGILQRICTRFVSNALDIVNIPHYNAGTIISVKEKDFGVEEACSGVQSLFFYFAIAAILAVYKGRNWFHTLTLIGSAVFWSFFTNSMRILIIAIMFVWFQIDLTHGLVHDLLGYAMMITGVFLIWSADLGLSVLTAPVDHEGRPDSQQSIPNPVIQPKQISIQFPALRWIIGAVFAIFFFIEMVDVATAYATKRDKIDFFTESPFKELQERDMPPELAGWVLKSYRRETRSRGADFGERSDVWTYQNGDREATVSFDQAFPGWHELTRCYEGAGWKTLERRVNPLPLPYNSVLDASYVAVHLQHSSGKLGALGFAFIDDRGNLMEPPGKWDLYSSMYHRVKNRMSPAIRNRIFGGAAYQVQCLLMFDKPDTASQEDASVSQLLSQAITVFQPIVVRN